MARRGQKHDELKVTVLEQIDVLAEYQRHCGLTTPNGARPRETGFLTCFALGREDRNPSAAINVETGVYTDSGSNGRSLSFWDAMVQFGPFRDWFEALNYFAEQLGLPTTGLKRPEKQTLDLVEEIGELTYPRCRGFLKRYPFVTLDNLKLCGARFARWKDTEYVIAFPVYGPRLTHSPHRAYVIQSANGHDLEDKYGQRRKRLAVGPGSGLLNWDALNRIAEGRAKVVVKVEGPTDMLALLAHVPEDKRGFIAVTTNACGATETEVPREFGPIFQDRDLVIIHDSDVPGQEGVERWIRGAQDYAKSIRNIVLHPDAITEKHGRDLANWLNEDGGSWEKLEYLAEQTEPVTESDEYRSPAQEICDRLGIRVHGHFENGDVLIYDDQIRRMRLNMDRFNIGTIEKLVCEKTLNTKIQIGNDDEPDPNRLTVAQIKSAINRVAYARRIAAHEETKGAGVWRVDDNALMLVQESNNCLWNGTGKIETLNQPTYGNFSFDLIGKRWFDPQTLQWAIDEANQNPDWCSQRMNHAEEIIARWDNWKYSDSPWMIASLLVCTWGQNIWPVRPIVGVTGHTNSGKSCLVEQTVWEIFNDMAWFNAKPSEAAIRQFNANTSKAILIDELEAGRQRHAVQMLLRTTLRGAPQGRGTPDGKGMEAYLRHIPWISATELGLTEATDVNRVLHFELKSKPKGEPSTLVIPPQAELHQLGKDLLVVLLVKWRTALDMMEPLRKMDWGFTDRRISEITAVPAAMYAAAHNRDINYAADLMRQSFAERNADIVIESDEHRVVEQILRADVVLERGKVRTVGQLLGQLINIGSDDWNDSATIMETLERHGIGLKVEGIDYQRATVFIHPTTVTAKLLPRESADKDLRLILRRMKRSRDDRHTLNGRYVRGLTIPINVLLGRRTADNVFLDEEDNE